MRALSLTKAAGTDEVGTRRRSFFFYFGFVLKYTVFLAVATALWKFLGDGAGKTRFHGGIMTVIASVLTIQEFLFFQIRGKLNETIRSGAVNVDDLDGLYGRIVSLKAYADRLWKIATPAKLLALALGATLFMGGNTAVLLTFHAVPITWDDVLAVGGWFLIFLGADVVRRTLLMYFHVDQYLTRLDVEARQNAIRKESSDGLKAEDWSDWKKDPKLRGYSRVRLSEH